MVSIYNPRHYSREGVVAERGATEVVKRVCNAELEVYRFEHRSDYQMKISLFTQHYIGTLWGEEGWVGWWGGGGG